MFMMTFIAVVIITVMAILLHSFAHQQAQWHIPTQGHLREGINDADDDKDYWYGTLVEATYQQWNGFANNARLYRE